MGIFRKSGKKDKFSRAAREVLERNMAYQYTVFATVHSPDEFMTTLKRREDQVLMQPLVVGSKDNHVYEFTAPKNVIQEVAELDGVQRIAMTSGKDGADSGVSRHSVKTGYAPRGDHHEKVAFVPMETVMKKGGNRRSILTRMFEI